MNSDFTRLWQRAGELFDELLEVPAAQREQALAQHCAGDDELAARVRRLLNAHQNTGEDSALHGGREVVAQAVQAWAHDGELGPGAQVGPFTVLRVLGVGGMGQVYLAHREIDGRRLQVALKLPRSGLTAEFLARFRRERAILAQLTHPAIARLIDAGEIADGRPYLAMEYVEGEPILDWCQRTRLDLPGRLRLACEMLDALQYAHQRLILHRDIKSANVMVDARGLVRVLDFGIGKELHDASNQATADGQRYFTLASAAPEQINGAPSSAATDVYAVGVLLYRLLSGAAPLDFDGISAHAALEHALQRVPPLASAAVSALSQATLVVGADERRVKPNAWATALSGDIDQILARALRKEPAARYQTAEAFAADLRAVLDSRPITARSNEHWYRMRRFVRRHALAVSLSAALLSSLGGFLGYTLLQSAALRVARDQAQQRQQQAEQAREQAEQVTAFLKDLFKQTDPRRLRGQELRAVDLLERGMANLKDAFADSPLLRAELYETLTDIQLSLNDFDAALQSAQQALALRAGDPAALRRGHESMAKVAAARGDFPLALQHLAVLLPDEAMVPGPNSSDEQLRWMSARASARFGAGEPRQQSIAAYLALATEFERRFGRHDARTRGELKRLAMAYGAAGNDAAERQLEEELTRNLDMQNSADDPALAHLLVRRARLLRKDGKLDEARRLAERGLQTQKKVYGEAHELVIAALALLGGIEKDAGRIPQALHHLYETERLATLALPPGSAMLAGVRFNLGSFLIHKAKRPADAIPHLKAAIAGQELGAPDSGNLRFFRNALAEAYALLGLKDDARREWQTTLALYQKSGGNKITRARISAQLDCLQPPAQRPPGARARLEETLSLLQSNADMDAIAMLEACRAGGR